jgi:hypothetical protein
MYFLLQAVEAGRWAQASIIEKPAAWVELGKPLDTRLKTLEG